jgi:hypothetical protein
MVISDAYSSGALQSIASTEEMGRLHSLLAGYGW